uniref:Uncharacterized protein LOC104246436 n=1 Tax=Nicotiana sylvestris TaxID=4096 RepID=A0A1U7Y8V3_NICSY|nr:PREDICTED: uncharacterized protein LOC104246436 [Nicotiana sylvestris]
MEARDRVVITGANKISHTGQSSHSSTMETWELADRTVKGPSEILDDVLIQKSIRRPSEFANCSLIDDVDVIIEADDETLTIEDPLAACLTSSYSLQVLSKCRGMQTLQITWQEACHTSVYEGHFGGVRTTTKVLEAGFYWSTMFKDAHQWVEATTLPTNDARVVVGFFKKNIFTRFGTPRAIISDRSTHFCNRAFEKLLAKYDVRHKVETPYNPQTSGQVEVSNREINSVLTKTVNATRTD